MSGHFDEAWGTRGAREAGMPKDRVLIPLRVAMPMLTPMRGGMCGSGTYARELAGRSELDIVASVPGAARGFSEGVAERSSATSAGVSPPSLALLLRSRPRC